MRFVPKTKEELELDVLMKEGVYEFEVVKAEESVSKSGNPMLKITLKIWDTNGVPRILFDYLLEALPYKLLHFCEVTGLMNKYQTGNLSAQDCVGKFGYAHIIIQQDLTNKYPPRNSIKDYVLKDEVSNYTKTEKLDKDTILDDDVPF